MDSPTLTTISGFTFDSWDEEVVLDEPGAKVVRTTFVKAISGDFAGSGRGDMVMAHGVQGAAAYSGVERLTGSIGRRAGSFILRHNAFTDSQGGGDIAVVVMDGSGTGGFEGVCGRAEIERHDDGSHTLTLHLDDLSTD